MQTLPGAPAPPPPTGLYGLPSLRERPRYLSCGLANPSAVLYSAAVGALLLLTGALTAALQNWMGGMRSRTPMTSFAEWVIPFAFAIFGMAFGIWAIRKGHVRSPWIAMMLNVLWAGCFLIGLDAMGGTERWFGALTMGADEVAAASETAQAVFLLFGVVILAAVGYQINGADALRVYYENQGCWADQAIAFYKANSGRKVLQALEHGNVRQLLEVKGDPPSSGHSWQHFTALALYTCPNCPDEPAYLYLKEVSMGGGPLFSSRFQTCFGQTVLKCVRLDEADLEVLRRLEPRLSDAVASGRGEVTLGTAARRGDKTPIGLPAGAPEQVSSAGGSWVEPLQPGDERSLRARYALGTYCTVISIPMIFGFAYVGSLLFDTPQPSPGPRSITGPELAFIGVFFAMMIFALILSILQPLVCKFLVRRGLRKRKYPLVPLSPDAVLVRIEDTRTFHKMKLVPDDVAILRPTREGLDIETSRHKIHLSAKDLKMELQQVAGGTGLNITASIGEWPFAITLAPFLKTFFWEGFSSMRPRLEELQREILRATMPAPPPLPPGVGRF